MSLDTRDKRASAIGVAGPWRVVFPDPDGLAFDQGDRQQLASCYRGILAGAPASGTFDPVEALAAWWSASAAMASLSSDGRLWFDEFPESVGMPRMLASLDRSAPEAWTTGYSLYKATVTVYAQAPLARTARGMIDSVAVAMTMAPLAVNGVSAMHVLPDALSLQVSPDRGPRGQDCWTASLAFEIFYQYVSLLAS